MDALSKYLDRYDLTPATRAQRIARIFRGTRQEVFEQVARETPLSPGAVDAVVGLRKLGYHVGIITGSNESIIYTGQVLCIIVGRFHSAAFWYCLHLPTNLVFEFVLHLDGFVTIFFGKNACKVGFLKGICALFPEALR